MKLGRSSSKTLDRAITFSIVAGVALLALVGLVFATAYGSRQITSEAISLHNTDEVLRSATVVRAQLAIAVHAGAVDRALGSDSSEVINLALGEAGSALDDLDTGIQALGRDGIELPPGLEEDAAQFSAVARAVIDAMTENRYADARALTEQSLTSEFDSLVVELVAMRDDLVARVASADALLGRVGDIARFLVAFFIPAAIVLLYRMLARRQARQEALESRLAAEQQLAKAREEFVATASHELRTPLTSITGLAMLLEESSTIQADSQSTELLGLIISEAGDLARMVEDLLTAARLDVGALTYDFEDVDIARAAADVVDSMQRAGVSAAVDCEPGRARADQTRLRQILRNLLANAHKYGGTDIQVQGRIEGNTYVCEVSDDGHGVPEEIRERLFQRFVHQSQATTPQGSVGLGLSIVHALAQGMGGSVSYNRSDGRTRFMVRLPLASVEVGSGGKAPSGEILVDDPIDLAAFGS
ncbi:MAG TPA: HAMP domain-containing histidine kinase [Acidimicrobiia bacterium]|nr:HAMP domain-containing histidine kinase [Acidimicrobiia bacterium]